jgi:hypothetical protein
MELVPRTTRVIGTAAPSEPASPTAPERVYYVRSKGTTVTDLLPRMKPHQRQELKDTLYEACLAFQLNIDWTVPIKRRLNKYPAGRMHKVYSALLRAGYTQIDQFSSVMAGLT